MLELLVANPEGGGRPPKHVAAAKYSMCQLLAL